MIELIEKEDLINKINAYMVTTADVTMVRKIIDELPTVNIIYCQECEFLAERESLEKHIKSRLPKELIGKCEKTGLYVRENDYCCGAE